MNAACCEVIGCDRQARWLLVVREHLYSEDYLCDRHWDLLHLKTPVVASHYAFIPSLLAEDTDLPIGDPAEIGGHAQCLIAYAGESPLLCEQTAWEAPEVRERQSPCPDRVDMAPDRLTGRPSRRRRSVKEAQLVR